MALPEIFGVPFLLAVLIVVVGLFLIRAAVTVVKILLIVALAVAVWLGVRWLMGQF